MTARIPNHLRHVRTTISIPPELKARMDRIQRGRSRINWSSIAAKAFAEFVSQQETANQKPVVSRRNTH